ncbi:MAG TPA: hypothetical protein VFB45_10330 [Pseudolabrys sp.]|nr:hypothetical protein [Pseudolabrys sp.]
MSIVEIRDHVLSTRAQRFARRPRRDETIDVPAFLQSIQRRAPLGCDWPPALPSAPVPQRVEVIRVAQPASDWHGPLSIALRAVLCAGVIAGGAVVVTSFVASKASHPDSVVTPDPAGRKSDRAALHAVVPPPPSAPAGAAISVKDAARLTAGEGVATPRPAQADAAPHAPAASPAPQLAAAAPAASIDLPPLPNNVVLGIPPAASEAVGEGETTPADASARTSHHRLAAHHVAHHAQAPHHARVRRPVAPAATAQAAQANAAVTGNAQTRARVSDPVTEALQKLFKPAPAASADSAMARDRGTTP